MPPLLLIAALAGASPVSAGACARFVVPAGPVQGMADAALVRRASGHDASPRSLGTTLAGAGWRIVWARPDDSEPGIFFFRGARGRERVVDIWGGPTAGYAGAVRWATQRGTPPALARCFARRLVAGGP